MIRRRKCKGWLGGRFDDTAGWFVVGLESNRSLVLRDEIERGSQAFVLKPIGENQTRLIVRVRDDQAMSLGKFFNLSVFEPAHFIMERKTLLTFKQTAEEFAADKVEKREPELLEQAVGA